MASASRIGATISPKGFARGLEGFTAQHRVAKDLQSTGIAELDEVLGGGLPRGSLVELCGSSSSGRTGLCLALLAGATRSQQTCAFVDASDALDPASLAAAGADLDRVLWVRCGGGQNDDSTVLSHRRHRGSEDMTRTKTHRHSPADQAKAGFSWRHPRDQIRGVERSIPSVLRGQRAAGARTQTIDTAARCAGEQVERDREEPRRGANIRTWSAPSGGRYHNESGLIAGHGSSRQTGPWRRLEQALRTTDLLLHSGGWGVVVLDLGNVSWVDARRIPTSTWFRFQRIVESTSMILVLLDQKPCAKACASVVLRCRRRQDRWRRVSHSRIGINTLQGFEVEGELVRSRTRLDRFDTAHWQTRSCWTRSA